MGYQECLIAAGAEIIEYKETGSYQGTWGAICIYNGDKVLVTGRYGSCSGCDAFQSEFDYGETEPTFCDGKYYINSDTWDSEKECTEEEYNEAKIKYNSRLSDFAQSYLQSPLFLPDVEQAIISLKKDDWFNEEELELYEWALPFFAQ